MTSYDRTERATATLPPRELTETNRAVSPRQAALRELERLERTERETLQESNALADYRYDAFKVTQWIYLVFGLVEGMIGIRFLLKFLGANPEAPVSTVIYGLTEPLLAPLNGMFPAYSLGVGELEPHATIAFLMYGLLGWAFGQIVWLFYSE